MSARNTSQYTMTLGALTYLIKPSICMYAAMISAEIYFDKLSKWLSRVCLEALAGREF